MKSFWAIALAVILLFQVVSFGNFSDSNFIQEADAKKDKGKDKDKGKKIPPEGKFIKPKKTKDPPRISTRGTHDLDSGALLPGNTLPLQYKKENGKIPGLDTKPCPTDIVVYVHGFDNDPKSANENFRNEKQSLEQIGYDFPLVGFTWDSNTVSGIQIPSPQEFRDADKIAKNNGKALAQFLQDLRCECENINIRLMSHSLGTRVVAVAILSLDTDPAFQKWRDKGWKVTNVDVLGAAVPNNLFDIAGIFPQNGIAVQNQVGVFTNHYNPLDTVLIGGYNRFQDPLVALGQTGLVGKPPNNYVDHNAQGDIQNNDLDGDGISGEESLFTSNHSNYIGVFDGNAVYDNGVNPTMLSGWVANTPTLAKECRVIVTLIDITRKDGGSPNPHALTISVAGFVTDLGVQFLPAQTKTFNLELLNEKIADCGNESFDFKINDNFNTAKLKKHVEVIKSFLYECKADGMYKFSFPFKKAEIILNFKVETEKVEVPQNDSKFSATDKKHPAVAAPEEVTGHSFGGWHAVTPGVSAGGGELIDPDEVDKPVLGGDDPDKKNDSDAAIWNDKTGIQELPNLKKGDSSFSTDVSADGENTVGWSNTKKGGSNTQATLHNDADGTKSLGTLAGGDNSKAFGISDDGKVVVGVSNDSFGFFNIAFKWTAALGMAVLGVFPGDVSYATDTSEDGSETVGTFNSFPGSSIFEAFKQTADGVINFLGFVDDGDISRAESVTPDGRITVGASNTIPGGPLQASRHTDGIGMFGLGVLPGDVASVALDVSADGKVVVGLSFDASSNSRAFIWQEGVGMIVLQDLLVNEFGLESELAGWLLQAATSVSNDGQAVTGFGIDPSGDFNGFITFMADGLAPPPPLPTLTLSPEDVFLDVTIGEEGVLEDKTLFIEFFEDGLLDNSLTLAPNCVDGTDIVIEFDPVDPVVTGPDTEFGLRFTALPGADPSPRTCHPRVGIVDTAAEPAEQEATLNLTLPPPELPEFVELTEREINDITPDDLGISGPPILILHGALPIGDFDSFNWISGATGTFTATLNPEDAGLDIDFCVLNGTTGVSDCVDDGGPGEVESGVSVPVTIDDEILFFLGAVDGEGSWTLEVDHFGSIFADGFESGDVTAWSSSVP